MLAKPHKFTYYDGIMPDAFAYICDCCMKQKHLHSTIGPAHAPNQHTQYVTLPFSYIELIVSGLYMLSREPGCARLYHTWRCEQ